MLVVIQSLFLARSPQKWYEACSSKLSLSLIVIGLVFVHLGVIFYSAWVINTSRLFDTYTSLFFMENLHIIRRSEKIDLSLNSANIERFKEIMNRGSGLYREHN